MRLVRSNMIDVLSQDYVRTARAKGLAGRPSWSGTPSRTRPCPVVAVLGLQFGQLLGGAVVTETVFAWPGVASFTVSSIANGDYPVVQAAVVILAASICIVNLSVDVLIGLPRPKDPPVTARELSAVSNAEMAVSARVADSSARARRLRQIWRLKGMVIGGAIVLIVMFLAVAAPLVAPPEPVRRADP